MEQKIMKALVKKIDDTFEKEYKELNEVGKEFSLQLDIKLLEAAKFYDKRYAVGQKKRKAGRFCKRQQFSFSYFFPSIPLQSGPRMPIASLYFRCLKMKKIILLTFMTVQSRT